jgi:pimeloyl-ACP methyl ester carboxylesterase
MSEQRTLVKELEDEYRFAILGLEFPSELSPEDFSLEQIREYFESDGESLADKGSTTEIKPTPKEEPQPAVAEATIFSPSDDSKIRILCFHGFQSCGNSLLKQLEEVRTAMPECEFVCPAHAGAWWKASDDGSTYEGWEDSIKFLRRTFKEQGPFDGKNVNCCQTSLRVHQADLCRSIGLFGFSQGAGLAALVCAMQQSESELAPVPQVRFVILYGGFRTRARAHQRFYRAKLQIPALSCIGLQDKVVPRAVSDELARSFSDSKVALFDVGHTITKERCEIKQIRQFVLPRFARS